MVDGLPTGCILVKPTAQKKPRHEYVSTSAPKYVCDEHS
jgi:hypothetical protein